MGSLVRHSVALDSCRTLSSSGLRLTVPRVWWSSSWCFLGLFAGVLSSRFQEVFADSSGWLSDIPWLSALHCLTAGGVALVFCQGHVGLP